MLAFFELDSVHWLIGGLLVTGCVVTVVVVIVRRAGRASEDLALRKMCPHCSELVQEKARKCDYCGRLLDKSRGR
jgi:hypothetical protein